MDYLKLTKKLNRETFIENIEPKKQMVIELGLGELNEKKMDIFVLDRKARKQAIEQGIHPDNIDTYVEALKLRNLSKFCAPFSLFNTPEVFRNVKHWFGFDYEEMKFMISFDKLLEAMDKINENEFLFIEYIHAFQIVLFVLDFKIMNIIINKYYGKSEYGGELKTPLQIEFHRIFQNIENKKEKSIEITDLMQKTTLLYMEDFNELAKLLQLNISGEKLLKKAVGFDIEKIFLKLLYDSIEVEENKISRPEKNILFYDLLSVVIFDNKWKKEEYDLDKGYKSLRDYKNRKVIKYFSL